MGYALRAYRVGDCVDGRSTPCAHAAIEQLGRALPSPAIQTFRDEFDGYSKNAVHRAGQEHFYEGLRKAGLPE